MTVRVGRPADEPALRALQSHLREPSPALLAHGLRSGGVLVDEASAGDDGGAATAAAGADATGATDDTAGAAGTVPVGYLLAVAGDGTHVAELVVHPAHRREGRATALLTRLIDRTDGSVTLLVAADNAPAQRLYEGLGFDRVEVRPGFYDDGTDAWLLARDPTPIGQADER